MNPFLQRSFYLNTALIILLVMAVFSPSLKNQFVNWDDGTILNYAKHMQERPVETLKEIFTRPVISTYIPLTVVSLSLDYKLSDGNPFVFHLNSLLFHLMNVWLIFVLCLRLNIHPRICLIAAILFGIHPMKVEPVCWVTARKDVLYAFFYLLAVHNYWSFLKTSSKKWYVTSVTLGLFSMLSKPMAISLPVILLLIDWYDGRLKKREAILNKIPYAIYLIPLALVTHAHSQTTVAVSSKLVEAVLIFVWSFSFYIYTFLFPHPLLALYQTPEPISLLNPIYFCSLIIFLGFVIYFIRSKKNKLIRFSMMFYVASVFYLLRFNKMEEMTVVGDRFIYLGSLGFCLLAAYAFHLVWVIYKKTWVKFILIISLAFVVGILSLKSFKQIKVWHDSIRLWSHVIRFNPTNALAHDLRGTAYVETGQTEKAAMDFQEAISINPKLITAYLNLASIQYIQKDYESSLENAGRALMINPQNAMGYYAKGLVYAARFQFDSALENFSQALTYDPRNAASYCSRGNIYAERGETEKALSDFNQAILNNPQYVEAYNSRGNLLTKLNRTSEAISDYTEAIAIDPNYAHTYNNLGYLYAQKDEDETAYRYFSQAIEHDPNTASFYVNRALILRSQKKFPEALVDLQAAQKIIQAHPEQSIPGLENLTNPQP